MVPTVVRVRESHMVEVHVPPHSPGRALPDLVHVQSV